MTPRKCLVVDANILLRAVLGEKVLPLLVEHEEAIIFCAPAQCFDEALRYIPELCERRNRSPQTTYAVLEEVSRIVESIDSSAYSAYSATAFQRISRRDPNDWPILATALLLDCPIWTEDQDFFGTGVATWTTNNVEIYLGDA